MISADADLRLRQRIGLGVIVSVVAIALFVGWVGAALLEGDPPDRRVFSVLVFAGLGLIFVFAPVGMWVWTRACQVEYERNPTGVPNMSRSIGARSVRRGQKVAWLSGGQPGRRSKKVAVVQLVVGLVLVIGNAVIGIAVLVDGGSGISVVGAVVGLVFGAGSCVFGVSMLHQLASRDARGA